MAKATIWIEDMAETFEEIDASWDAYLKTDTGEIIFVPLDSALMEDFSEEEKELFSTIDIQDDYLRFPTQKELREFDIMEEYAQGCVNPGFQHRLLFALRNNKPFRNFRSQLRLLNLEDDYAHYRYMIFAAKARSWCMEHEIPYTTENDEIKDYFKDIEEDERIEKDLDDFEDTLDEFTYDDEYE